MADCVHRLLEIGVKKDDISLMTHHDEENEMTADSMSLFQKNGDISSEMGGAAVGGIFGLLLGSFVGVASSIIPPVGLVVSIGPMMSAVFGGVLGGTFGNEIVKTIDVEYSDTGPLHPYIAALKQGDVICGVEADVENTNEIQAMMSKYASCMFS